MKKLLAILAACTAMTLSFVSCGYSDDDDKSSKKDSKSSVSDDSDDEDDKSDSKKDKDSDDEDDDSDSKKDKDSDDKDDDSDSKKDKDSDDKDDNSDSKKDNDTESDDDNDSDSDAEKVIMEYAESIYGKDAAEKYYSLILPDEYLDYMMNDEADSWEELLVEYNDEVDGILEDYSIEVTEVKLNAKMTDSQIACVKEYFNTELEIENAEASKGYEYHIEIEGTDSDGGIETEEGDICVVKLDEGWKIIEETAEDIEYYYSE